MRQRSNSTDQSSESRPISRDASRGFTIVELLIVIVVIGILAAISIVAYNGIQQRARASAASSALSQAAKKLALYQVDNGSYPANLGAVGIQDGADVTYQYSVDNSAAPPTFCVTATAGNVSYKVSQSGSPSAGGCAGHGQGGQAAITNLASDPRATTYSMASGTLGWGTGRWFGTSPATGGYSLVTGASDGPAGVGTYGRKTWTTAPAAIGNSGDTGYPNSPTGSNAFAVSAGTSYTISCYLRPSVARNFHISVYLYDGAGAGFTPSRSNGPLVAGAANQWTRVTYTYTVPSGVGRIATACDSASSTANGAVNWAVGSTLDGTALMIAEGSAVPNYADGNSPSWTWNGASNNSTSTGPAL